MMKKLHIVFIYTIILAATAGCETTGVTKQVTPKISHAHIGHALTSWVDTPGQKGLFVVAENYSKEAARFSDLARAPGNSLSDIKSNINSSMLAITGPANAKRDRYSLEKALTKALNHIKFAADSKDASANIKDYQVKIASNSKSIFYRIETIKALAAEINKSSNAQEARELAELIHKYNVQNIKGLDENGDGIIGNLPTEYGLKQVRDLMYEMINNEVPAYRPVEQKYLFGLVRLPDGTWQYKFDKSADDYGRY